MAARKGNQNRRLLKTAAERQALWRDLIRHLEQGCSLKSFTGCSRNTLKTYLQQYPEDFPREEIEIALQTARKMDEVTGLAATSGRPMASYDPRRFNPTVWMFRMRNRWGWKLEGGEEDDLDGFLSEGGGGGDGPGSDALHVSITVRHPATAPAGVAAGDKDNPGDP